MANPLGKAKEGRGKSEHTNKHRVAIPFQIDQVIKESDIILEVLDARFIEKTRNTEIEQKVKDSGKILIYIFNKSDLVDVDKVRQEEGFKELKPNMFFSSKDRKGSAILRKLIKMELKKIKKDLINVGIIGYPNTGKSSLINLLVGRSVSRTSSEAGFTKGIQKLKISNGVYLVDTPGIIPPAEKTHEQRVLARHSQIGAITWDRAKDPQMVVNMIMQEYLGILEKHYRIDAKGDSEVLIEKLGRRSNYLKKGNLVDENRTAKKILKDWQEGKIRVR